MNNQKREMPVIPLRGLVVFPYMILHFDVGRRKSVLAIEEALAGNGLVFLSAQMDEQVEEPSEDDIFEIGTIAKVKQMLKLPGDNIRVLVEGINRGRLLSLTATRPFLRGEVHEFALAQVEQDTPRIRALIRSGQDLFAEYFQVNGKFAPETIQSVMNIVLPGQLADVIAGHIAVPLEEKQALLECLDVEERLEKLIKLLTNEMEIIKIERSIQEKVKKEIDENQREYYLRQQLKVISQELGEKDGMAADVMECRERMKGMNLPQQVQDKLEKELSRLEKMSANSPDAGVLRTYIDWVLDLPWNVKTQDNLDLERAAQILDEDHYGLQKVKERILEFLAVKKLSNSLKGPILCLVGPPGVGKTSIARSIARALGRSYVRISLGGVKDESEIRGHRKTYVGAMPGRIITALRQAKSANPLMLFDEIDKMSQSYNGDPAAAMLEVLDSEQNFSFRDHYIELPFDLSDVLFLVTANTLDSIPRPLLDRMEIIELGSYVAQEKLEIARRYLLPKQIRENGLKKGNLRVAEGALSQIIEFYTRESGVRSLERELGQVCRRAAKLIATGEKKVVSVTAKNLESFLGKKKYDFEAARKKDTVGVATGLAWTAVGGDTLSIEVNVMEGTGRLELTGQLGDVMKESAMTALSYVRSQARSLGIDHEFYKAADIHIHVPEGATPKDGPSAGITMATAITSALSGYPVSRDVAMTGEITLRGRVLPIGGLKEKAIAAHRAGIHTVIIPKDNEKDLEDIPENVRGDLRFVPVDHVKEVFGVALGKKQTAKPFRAPREKAPAPGEETFVPILDQNHPTGRINARGE